MEPFCYPIFDADDHAYDTSSVIHLRSSPDLTPDAILLHLFRNAHHPDSLSAQLTVVWWLLPEAATGGPASISIAVTNRPTLLSCHTRTVREPLDSYRSHQANFCHTYESHLSGALHSCNVLPLLPSIRQMFCFHQNLLLTLWLLATLFHGLLATSLADIQTTFQHPDKILQIR